MDDFYTREKVETVYIYFKDKPIDVGLIHLLSLSRNLGTELILKITEYINKEVGERIIYTQYFEDLEQFTKDLFSQIYMYCNLKLKHK